MSYNLPKPPRFTEVSGAKQWTIHYHNDMARVALSELLETKHLYQKVSVDPKPVANAVSETIVYPADKDAYKIWLAKQREHLKLVPATQPRLTIAGSVSQLLSTLIIDNVKLYCSNCGGREAFAPIWFADTFNSTTRGGTNGYPSTFSAGPDSNMVLIHFQCLICKTRPEILLIERDKWELKLHGRSPMETVEVPHYIPKAESRLYSDGVIAFDSGKTLAALFYLRSFLEQFARRVTGTTEKLRGDELMEKYNEGLPSPQRDWMPSLRDAYEKISIPIHSATDDVATFNDMKAKVDKHFEIRKVHEISEKPPEKPNDKTEEKDSTEHSSPKPDAETASNLGT
jgi:hypothetical protein